MERDRSFKLSCSITVISTHTLTWSVTREWERFLSSFLNFNSHAHVERDKVLDLLSRVQPYFNSHAHVERDQSRRLTSSDLMNFNSHAHVERDSVEDIARFERKISTHTLTWSVTKFYH